MRWLHISDLHFGNQEDATLDEMWKKLCELSQRERDIDYLFITGDLRLAGDMKGGEYPKEDILKYIKSLQTSFKIAPKNTFLVPGNHDVDRDSVEPFLSKAVENYKRGIIGKKYLDLLKPTRKYFRKIYKDICGRPEPDGWHYCEKLDEFNIICLNTAILSGQNDEKQGDEDNGRLILGQGLLNKAFKEINKELPSIILAHHEWNCIFQDDRNALISNMRQYKTALYLCGHAHEKKVRKEENLPSYLFMSGTLEYDKKNREKPDLDVLIGEIHRKRGGEDKETEGHVTAYRWESSVRAWLPDPSFSYAKNQGLATDGIYYFPERPKYLRPLHQTAKDKYLSALREQCGKADLLDLMNVSVPTGDASLSKIFVPPYFRRTTFEAEEKRMESTASGVRTAAKLKPRHDESQETSLWTLLEQSQPFRIVILSDAGGGKSTLLKYIADDCAAKISSGGDVFFPVWLPSRCIRSAKQNAEFPILRQAFRLFNERNGKNSPISPMEYDNGKFLDEILNASERTAVLFLIDGLDEIKDRKICGQFLRELIQIAQKFQKLNFIVTLRNSGFDALSNPDTEETREEREKVKEEYKTFFNKYYQIAPPDERDIRKLCENWLSLDAQNKKDEASRLADGIIKRRGSQRLALNPLTLTVMLLLYYRFGQMPKQDATLYADASNLMLERWVGNNDLIDKEEARYQLAYIAFWIGMDLSDEICRSKLVELLEEMRKNREDLIYRNQSDDNFLNHIEQREALLLPDGPVTDERQTQRETVYIFQHRMFLEYFAALAAVRNYDPSLGFDKSPSEKFKENLFKPKMAGIVTLAAALDQNFGRNLVTEIVEIMRECCAVGSQEWLRAKRLLLRFLADEVPLQNDLITKILETCFPGGVTKDDPDAFYWILNGRYKKELKDYFQLKGETDHPEEGGGRYWMTFLDILAGKSDLRNIYQYYRNPDHSRLDALSALSAAIWLFGLKQDKKERSSKQEKEELYYPNMPEFDPIRSVLELSDSERYALTDEILEFAENESDPALQWQAMRILREGYIRETHDLMDDPRRERYLKAYASYLENHGKLPPTYDYAIFFCVERVTENGVFDLNIRLSSGLESVRTEIERNMEAAAHDRREIYGDLLVLYIIAALCHADPEELGRISDLIDRERDEIGNLSFDDRDEINRLAERFRETMRTAFPDIPIPGGAEYIENTPDV